MTWISLFSMDGNGDVDLSTCVEAMKESRSIFGKWISI